MEPQQEHTQNGVQKSSSCSWPEWSAASSTFSWSQFTSSVQGNTDSANTIKDNMRAKIRTDKSTLGIKEIQNLLRIL